MTEIADAVHVEDHGILTVRVDHALELADHKLWSLSSPARGGGGEQSSPVGASVQRLSEPRWRGPLPHASRGPPPPLRGGGNTFPRIRGGDIYLRHHRTATFSTTL